MGIVQQRAQRIVKADKAYRNEEVKYALSVMKGMDQEQLIKEIKDLNINELKAIISCGVPGRANHIAKLVLDDKKRALEVFVQNDGIEAIMQTEGEEPNNEDEDPEDLDEVNPEKNPEVQEDKLNSME